jgi:hypothetical protein
VLLVTKIFLLPVDTQGVSSIHDSYKTFSECLQDGLDGYALCDSPNDADWILVCNVWGAHQCRANMNEIFLSREYKQYRRKFKVYNDFDNPAINLPGAYTSSSKWTGQSKMSRAVPYLNLPSHDFPEYVTPLSDRTGLSFYAGSTGPEWSAGHRLRIRLMQTFHQTDTGKVEVKESPWTISGFSGSADDAYVQNLLAHRIALCPRGAGNASYRIYEAILCGAVPMVIADDYIRPMMIERSAVLQWSERFLGGLPSYSRFMAKRLASRQTSIDESRNRLMSTKARCQFVLNQISLTPDCPETLSSSVDNKSPNRIVLSNLKIALAVNIVLRSMLDYTKR